MEKDRAIIDELAADPGLVTRLPAEKIPALMGELAARQAALSAVGSALVARWMEAAASASQQQTTDTLLTVRRLRPGSTCRPRGCTRTPGAFRSPCARERRCALARAGSSATSKAFRPSGRGVADGARAGDGACFFARADLVDSLHGPRARSARILAQHAQGRRRGAAKAPIGRDRRGAMECARAFAPELRADGRGDRARLRDKPPPLARRLAPPPKAPKGRLRWP